MATRIVRSEASRIRLEEWYHRFLNKITAPVEHRMVPTSLGPSHVLIAGDEDAPPLMALHAMLTGSAQLLSELGPVLKQFRVIAPDLPGQSIRGPAARLPLKDDSLARWLLEVADGLDLDSFHTFGVSWGGFVARQLASTAPERVRRLGLLVPAGIVNGQIWKGLSQMALPMLIYRLRPTKKHLQRLVAPLLTTWDDDWAHFIGDMQRNFLIDMRIPPLASDEDLRKLTMPTLVIAGDEDLSFPGQKLLDRVQRLVPDAEVELIKSCKHCPPTTDEFRRWLGDRLITFYTSEPKARSPAYVTTVS